MRATVLLLMVVQLVAFPMAAAAEVPPAENHHTEHISDDAQACQPFHDELTCVTCRVLSNQPVGTPSAPALAPAPAPATIVVPAAERAPSDAAVSNTLRARAPPRT